MLLMKCVYGPNWGHVGASVFLAETLVLTGVSISVSWQYSDISNRVLEGYHFSDFKRNTEKIERKYDMECNTV